MGKRSNFKRNKRDLYETIEEKAVYPLIPHLECKSKFVEPCAGRGLLIDHLHAIDMKCVAAYDIKPLKSYHTIKQCDVLNDRLFIPKRADYIITNPPWRRDLLHPMIEIFSDRLPTWLLFDADWMHTVQSASFLDRLVKVVSVGRLRWIKKTKMTGKENSAWYLFDKPKKKRVIKFYGREQFEFG